MTSTQERRSGTNASSFSYQNAVRDRPGRKQPVVLSPMNKSLLENWTIWQYAQSLSPRTVTERLDTVTRMANWLEISPELVNMEDIARWLAEGGDWKPTTRHTYHSHLTAWFLWLQRMDHRTDNPMLKIGKPRRPRSQPHPVSNPHLQRILTQRMHKRTRVMVLFATLSGLRVSEIAKLRGEHIDLAGRQIRVIGKGGVAATLPLHPLLIEAAWTMPRKGWWFPANSTRTGHVLGRSVGSAIKSVMTRAGVPGSAHSLRHWFGTSLVANNVDLRTAQELLRHASLATTQIYTAVADSRKAEGVGRLDPWDGAA